MAKLVDFCMSGVVVADWESEVIGALRALYKLCKRGSDESQKGKCFSGSSKKDCDVFTYTVIAKQEQLGQRRIHLQWPQFG